MLLALATKASPAAGWQDLDPSFRKTAGEVEMELVVSRQWRAVTSLHKEEVAIFQDERPVGELTGFYPAGGASTQVWLMLDTSASMSRDFAQEKNMAESLLQRLTRPGIDPPAAVTVAAHAGLPEAGERMSPQDWDRIAALQPSGLTALFDAVCSLSARAGNSQAVARRQILILLSDGDDTYSRHTVEEAVTAAQKSHLVIYAITAHSRKTLQWGDVNLQRLTSETGGQVFFLKNFAHADSIVDEVERRVRSAYSVTFRPADQGCGFHRVRIELADRSLRAHARAGFYGECP